MRSMSQTAEKWPVFSPEKANLKYGYHFPDFKKSLLLTLKKAEVIMKKKKGKKKGY